MLRQDGKKQGLPGPCAALRRTSWAPWLASSGWLQVLEGNLEMFEEGTSNCGGTRGPTTGPQTASSKSVLIAETPGYRTQDFPCPLSQELGLSLTQETEEGIGRVGPRKKRPLEEGSSL